jgi:hypothetical protein
VHGLDQPHHECNGAKAHLCQVSYIERLDNVARDCTLVVVSMTKKQD